MAHRPIYHLLVALWAREPLTATELQRIRRYYHHSERLTRLLTMDVSPTEREPFVETGTEHEDLRKDLRRNLRKKTVAELRLDVRLLLVLGRIGEELRAELVGLKRRWLHQSRAGSKVKAADAAAAVREIQDWIEASRRRRQLTITEAVRAYLRESDDQWWRVTDREREGKVRSLMRRLQRAKKK